MREQILEGVLEFIFYEQIEAKINKDTADFFNQMNSGLWHNFMHKRQAINIGNWLQRYIKLEAVKNPVTTFNKVIKELSRKGWIVIKANPNDRWAEAIINEDMLLEYVNLDELNHVIAKKKFKLYMLNWEDSKVSTITSNKGYKAYTGHHREGFQKSTQTQFYYDTDMLTKYKKHIIRNVNKSMEKVRIKYPDMVITEDSYDSISTQIVEHLADNPELFTMGQNYSDIRGRAIKSGLRKVFNPVGFKDSRALLTIPE